MIRALIVDDEPLARSRVRLLAASHCDVEIIAECSSGREAEQVMTSETPALLFLDVEMPDAGGFAIAAARDAERTPAVVFVTAHEEFALQAFEANAVDYLVKPFSQERFDRAGCAASSAIAHPRRSRIRRPVLRGAANVSRSARAGRCCS